MPTLCNTSNSLYTVLFLNEARFLSTVFLCSEFKLENIFPGVNVCRNLFFGIAGKNAKNANIRTRKNFVTHGSPQGLSIT